MQDDSPLFPGSFAGQYQFDLAWERLETHLFFLAGLPTPPPLSVRPVPKVPGEIPSLADLLEAADAVRAILARQPSAPKLRWGKRVLVIGSRRWDNLSPPSAS